MCANMYWRELKRADSFKHEIKLVRINPTLHCRTLSG